MHRQPSTQEEEELALALAISASLAEQNGRGGRAGCHKGPSPMPACTQQRPNRARGPLPSSQVASPAQPAVVSRGGLPQPNHQDLGRMAQHPPPTHQLPPPTAITLQSPLPAFHRLLGGPPLHLKSDPQRHRPAPNRSALNPPHNPHNPHP